MPFLEKQRDKTGEKLMGEMYDRIIIGAGLYGLYAARFCGKLGQKVLVLEYDQAPFERATYINQARVHMGYHYPRSLTTAVKSAGYFRRFCRGFWIFVFMISSIRYTLHQISFSWTNARQFMDFFVRRPEFGVMRYLRPAILSPECVMGLF